MPDGLVTMDVWKKTSTSSCVGDLSQPKTHWSFTIQLQLNFARLKCNNKWKLFANYLQGCEAEASFLKSASLASPSIFHIN
jgi:hypothetical protein